MKPYKGNANKMVMLKPSVQTIVFVNMQVHVDQNLRLNKRPKSVTIGPKGKITDGY